MEEKLCRDRFGYAVKKLREMRKNKIFTDVILDCKGGSIHAHRCVLMASSQFFYNLLTSNLAGDSLIQIEFETIPVAVIEAIVTSFYGEIQTGLQNDTGLILRVLKTCQHMQEELLINYCMNSLLNNMSIDNCFQLWDIAIKYEHSEAEEKVMTYILNHLEKVTDLYDEKLGRLSVDQMEALISFAKELSIPGEFVAEAIINWGQNSPEATLEKIIAFFCLQDVTKLSRQFVRDMMSSEFVKNSVELTKFLSSFSFPVSNELSLSYKQDLQMHFYHQTENAEGRMVDQAYSFARKEWCMAQNIKLPVSLAKEWCPLNSLNGEKFHFAVSIEKKFVAYNERNRQLYTGPSVTLENQVTGVVDGRFMYVWNYEKLVKFDVESKTWKHLTPIVNVIAHSNLLALNGKLYYHASSLSSILLYNFSNNEWEFKKPLRDVTNVLSIKCKCFQKNCKKKLYFVRNDTQLVSYDTENDVWAGKFLPELNMSEPIFMSCDEPFIIFNNKVDRSSFFVYYPDINVWKSFEAPDFNWKNSLMCDLVLK